MGTKNNDSCLKNAAEDEPIFVLRAQDVLAPGLVREWCDRARKLGVRGPKLLEAAQTADKMEAWQVRSGRAKNPD